MNKQALTDEQLSNVKQFQKNEITEYHYSLNLDCL